MLPKVEFVIAPFLESSKKSTANIRMEWSWFDFEALCYSRIFPRPCWSTTHWSSVSTQMDLQTGNCVPYSASGERKEEEKAVKC